MFDARHVLEVLRGETEGPPVAPFGGWPAGAPVREWLRSPAAIRVSRFASESGLFLFHYDHCAWRELPEDWLPPERSDLAEPPAWSGGILAEHKYQSFRHDQQIGGFHPGQRAKWSSHELCHGLVGTAWKSGATPFFLATAGRLAELLPVALWYFFDEAFLQRCPVHAEYGALFRSFCPACDAAAAVRSDDLEAEARIRGGLRFLDRELAAIARSRRLGRPISHIWSSIDLASDGVAYAGAHAARLSSEAFQRYIDGFGVFGGGLSEDLDRLEARVVEVARGLLLGETVSPLAPTRTQGTARWVLQDVAWRLWTVWHDTADEAAEGIAAVIDGLRDGLGATRVPGNVQFDVAGAVERAAERYAELEAEYILPSLEEAFSVGYDLLPGLGRSVSQLLEGVRSATPLTAEVLGDSLEGLVEAFAGSDGVAGNSRAGLGQRWAEFIVGNGVVSELARFESLLAFSAPGDEEASALGPQGRSDSKRLARGLQVEDFSVDVVRLAERAEQGEICWVGGALVTAKDPVESVPTALIVGRLGAGDLLVLDVAPETAAAIRRLGEGSVPNLHADETQSLCDLGVLVPSAWSE